MADKGELIGHDVRVRWQDRRYFTCSPPFGIIGRRQMIHWSRDKNERDMSQNNKPVVLVVEPSAANQALICECLGQLHDVQPEAVGGGEAALRCYRALAPALVLLDTTLPDLDGLEVARRIRALEKSSERADLLAWTPIVFLSSATDDEALARGIMAGGDDYLTKPISEIVLLAKVRAMLRITTMREALRDAHRLLTEMSYVDGLTHIPNRRRFDDVMASEWRRAIRQRTPLGVIVCDVDRFKQYNDHYGHQAGDRCLEAVAGALHDSLFRIEDMVARYGGEEFAAVLPGDDVQGAAAVAERMRLSVESLRIPHDEGVAGFVTCSFGVATGIPGSEGAAADLLRAADEALYAAKKAGRNRVAVSGSRHSTGIAV